MLFFLRAHPPIPLFLLLLLFLVTFLLSPCCPGETSQGIRQRNSSLPLRQLVGRSKSRKTALDLGDLILIGEAWEIDVEDPSIAAVGEDPSLVGDESGEADDSLLLPQPPISQVNSRLWRASYAASASLASSAANLSSSQSSSSPQKGTLFIRASRFRGLNNILFGSLAQANGHAGGSEDGASAALEAVSYSVLLSLMSLAAAMALATVGAGRSGIHSSSY